MKAERDAIKHCRGGTKEKCGLIIERGQFTEFYPCDNIAKDRRNDFLISPDDYLIASMRGKVVAVVHSHNKDQLNHLSSADRISQYKNALDWWLVKDGELKKYSPVKKLKGRIFDEGYLDCYDCWRDLYRLAGLEMGCYSPAEGYRIPDWYKMPGAKSPFLEFVKKEGFVEVEKLELIEPGDVIFSTFGASVPNHCIIYVGDNKIFHHLPGKLSMVEDFRPFFMKFKHSIWRYSDRDSINLQAALEILKEE